MIIFGIVGFAILFYLWARLLWKMLRVLGLVFWGWRTHRLTPPQGFRYRGRSPERIALSEAEMIEQGITHLGGHGGFDSLHSL